MIDKTLEKLGLREDEAKAFIFLIENGEQTAGNLAKKTGLSRPSLYGFLKKMQSKDLVVESQKNGVKTFFASSKEKIQKALDEEIDELEKGKNDIEKIFSEIAKGGFTTSPKFQFFEGKDGVQHVLKDLLLYRDIKTKTYWPIKAMMELLSEKFFHDHNIERIKRRIYIEAIWPEKQIVDMKKHPYMGNGEKFYREIKIAPKEIDFTMGYWIYENKVAFISSKKESFGFIIESKEFVEMMTSQHGAIWKISKKLPDVTEAHVKDFLGKV